MSITVLYRYKGQFVILLEKSIAVAHNCLCEHMNLTDLILPVDWPWPDLWGKREEAEGMLDTAGELVFLAGAGALY